MLTLNAGQGPDIKSVVYKLHFDDWTDELTAYLKGHLKVRHKVEIDARAPGQALPLLWSHERHEDKQLDSTHHQPNTNLMWVIISCVH